MGRGNLVPRPRSAGLYERHNERMTEDRTEKTGPSGAAGKLGDIAADAGPRAAGGVRAAVSHALSVSEVDSPYSAAPAPAPAPATAPAQLPALAPAHAHAPAPTPTPAPTPAPAPAHPHAPAHAPALAHAPAHA